MEKLIWFLVLMWNLEPPFFKELEMLDRIYILGRFAAAYFLLLLLIVRGREYRPGKFLGYLLAMEWCIFFSTFWNGGYSVLGLMMNEITGITFMILMDYLLDRDFRFLISLLTLVFEILIYGNLFTVLVFPQGLYNLGEGRKYWLLGQVNQIILYLLPAILLELLHNRYVVGKERMGIRAGVMLGVGIFTGIRVWSATSLVGLFIMISMVLAGGFVSSGIKLKWGIAGSILIFGAFVIFRIQNLFSYFIVDILHRNLTFSTRITVWDMVLKCIRDKWLLGYGMETTEAAVKRFGYMTPHNRYLYLLYQGGLLMLAVFMGMLADCGKTLRQRINSKAALLCISSISAFLIMMQFESYNTPIFFIPFLLSFRIEKITELEGGTYEQRNSFTDIAGG